VIFGIGTDLVEVARIERLWERHGETFARRILMPEEWALFQSTRRPVRFLAMRFAAKEALVKGLGTGFAHGVWVRDVGVVSNDWGRPVPIFSARGRSVAQRLGAGEAHVSLTDEAGMVMAVAVVLVAGAGAGP
jgi:holo-[acyl-carrier protein] synthase